MLKKSFLKIYSAFSTSKTQPIEKKLFFLTYQYVEDVYYKRIPHTEQHNKLIQNLEKSLKAKIVGGPTFPMEKGCLWFYCDDKSIVEDFVKSDPYFTKKLVKDYSIENLDSHSLKDFEYFLKNYQYKS